MVFKYEASNIYIFYLALLQWLSTCISIWTDTSLCGLHKMVEIHTPWEEIDHTGSVKWSYMYIKGTREISPPPPKNLKTFPLVNLLILHWFQKFTQDFKKKKHMLITRTSLLLKRTTCLFYRHDHFLAKERFQKSCIFEESQYNMPLHVKIRHKVLWWLSKPLDQSPNL